MADQGAVIITHTAPVSTARGLLISGAGTLSATLRAVGVLVEPTDSTETKGRVQISGTALVVASGVIAAGTPCRSDAAGKLAATAADGSDADLACAVLLEDAGADGELVNCKIY